MNSSAKNTNSLLQEPAGINDTSGGYRRPYDPKEDAPMGKRRANFFLTDEDLDRIKCRIRKKDRTDTKRLLLLYGILLVAVLWFLGNYWVF